MINNLDLCTKAESLRKKLGAEINSPINIKSLIQSIDNLTLIFYPMGNNLSGLCIKDNETPIIAINSSMSIGRQNFSMAHELYHLYYDENNHIPACSKAIGSGQIIEKTADQFASYFLITPISLSETLSKFEKDKLEIKEIVFLEQYYGVSRKAILYRLMQENKITYDEAEAFKQNVILSAIELGYDDTLYKPLADNKQYATYGYYIKLVNKLLNKEIISNSKFEELLLNAFRVDLVYGDNFVEEELND